MSTTLRNFGASGAGGSSGRGDSRQPGDAEVWLSGDSIGCVCPKCGLDAGVRVGDAFAECTSCRVTWPLTEPQRQAARGLLAGFRRAQQAAAPAADSPPDAPATFNPFRSPNTSDSPHSSPDRAELGDAIEPPGAGSSISSATSGPAEATSGSGAVAEPIREKKRVVIVRKRRPAGAPVAVGPTGALAPVQPLPPRPTPYKAVSGDPVAAGTATPTAEAGQPADAKAANAQVAPPGERRRLVDLVDDVPGWLISLVVHLVLVIVLGLIYLPHEGNSNSFNLLGSLGEDSAEDPARGDRYDPADDFTETEEFSAPGELASAEPAELPSPVVPEPPAAASEAPVEAADVPVTFQPTLVRPAASEPAPAEESNPRRSRSSRSPRGGASGGAESDAPHAPGMPGLTGTPGGFDGRGSKMRGDLLEFYGGNEDSESAVAKGLRWLAKVQEPNGRWSLEKWGGASPSDTAATGLGLLPFLAAGQTHKEGEYQKTVYRALDWLKANQLTNGDLRSGVGNMYAHGICTIALCEAYGMTKDPELRQPAQKAVDFIVAAQHGAGGWRYEPKEPGDMSVVGWQMMALRSAQLAYLDVPQETIDDAKKFLDRVASQSGDRRYGATRYSYLPNSAPSEVMTAEAMLCRQYTGWKRSEPAMGEVARWLVSEHLPGPQQGVNMYYIYYGTQFLHHYGGEPWKAWNNRVRDGLVNTQVQNGELAGSWTPSDQWGVIGGRIYSTSLSLLSLEVYYRHLPIYDAPQKDVQQD